MENHNIYNQYIEEKAEGIDTQKILSKAISNWYWFVLFGIVGLGTGLFYQKYKPAEYSLSSTIIVKKDGQGGLASMFQDLGMNSKSPDLQTQVGVLKSYSINLKAIKNLDWKYSWYQPKVIGKADLYQRDPFLVKMSEEDIQTYMLPVYITVLSPDTYRAQVDGEINQNGIKEVVTFEKELKFGQPLQNAHFNFTLNKKENRPIEEGEEFILVFNDLNKLALNYKEELSVKLDEDESNLIYTGLKSKMPVRAVHYLNELNSVYIQFGLNEKNRLSDNTLSFIDRQIASVTDSLRRAGENFTDFRARNRVVDLGHEGGLILDKLEELESTESMSKIRMEYYANLRQYLKNADQMKDLVAPSVVGITDPALNASVLKLSELYNQREVLSYTVQDKNPSLIALNNEIRYTQRSLEENVNNLINGAEIELESIGERKSKINKQLARLPETEQDMINIRRNFDLNNELYTYLLQRRAEVGITKASNEPDANILDPARIDTAIDLSPGRLQIGLIGLLAGLGFPFMIIVLSDYLNNKIQSLEDVEKEAMLPVLACIAHNQYAKELPVIDHPRSGIAESFRSLRTKIHYLNKEQQVISVHSTVPSEGKSFTSLNLATIFAMNNKKVLLVGADLRKPRLHLALNCDNHVGLSTYLNGSDDFEAIVSSTDINNLHFVASGPIPPDPAELLESTKLMEFICEARDRFDYIIIDNAPLALVTDGVLLGRHSDINLFMLRQGKSKKSQLKYLDQVANQGIIRKAYLVLNDVKSGSGSATYGNYGNGKGYYVEGNEGAKSIWKKLTSKLESA